MKKLLLFLALFVCSFTLLGQYKIDPVLKSNAQELVATQHYNVNIFVDTTSSKTYSDLKEIMIHVNNVYAQVGIHFKISTFTYGGSDYNPYLSVIASIKRLTNNWADISLYITGRSDEDVIGAAHTNCIGTLKAVALVDLSLQDSNKDCSRVIIHEFGHLFGLYHSGTEDYIMSEEGNLTYSSKFSSSDKEKLKNYSKTF